jgi:hypothetical protein
MFIYLCYYGVIFKVSHLLLLVESGAVNKWKGKKLSEVPIEGMLICLELWHEIIRRIHHLAVTMSYLHVWKKSYKHVTRLILVPTPNPHVFATWGLQSEFFKAQSLNTISIPCEKPHLKSYFLKIWKMEVTPVSETTELLRTLYKLTTLLTLLFTLKYYCQKG